MQQIINKIANTLSSKTLIFSIEVLFFSNAWIYLYRFILRFLNLALPVGPPKEQFIRPDFSPEPYEIPLYLAVTIFIVFLLFLYNRFIKPGIKLKAPLVLKVILFLALGYSFFINLGSYPMAHEIYPYSNLYSPLTYHLYIFFYLITVGVIILEFTIFFQFMKHKKMKYLLYLLLLCIIALITFEPQFPTLGHDYSFIIGPIWEIAHGKSIFTPNPSFYGFLSILLLTIFYKIHLVNLWYLPAINWLGYIIQYFAFFYIIHKVSRSTFLALMGLFSLITINYFSLFLLPGMVPQTGLLRWFPLLISLLLLMKFKDILSLRFTLLIALLSLWTIDTGISLILSYVFALAMYGISRPSPLKTIIGRSILLVTAIISYFLFIQLLHIILGYQPIDVSLIFMKLSQFSRAGFGMLPLPNNSFFWFVILIYFASISYFFTKKKSDCSHQALLFSANISLFSAVYFVGRSHPHNLFHIGLFFLLNLFVLLGMLLQQLSSIKLKLLFGFSLFFFLVVFPAYKRQEMIIRTLKEKIQRFQTADIFAPEAKTILEKKYQTEIELIKKEFPQKKVVILSDDDTYLLLMSNKESLINYNPQIANIAVSDFKFSLKNVFQQCPKKIIGDCRLFEKCSSSDPFSLSYLFIQPQYLQEINRSCRMSYVPTKCTEHLCLASGLQTQ